MITFNSKEFGDINAMVLDDQPWFIGEEIAKALNNKKPWQMVAKHVAEEDKHYEFINLAGVLYLTYVSHSPAASRLKNWILTHVLPKLYKTGNDNSYEHLAAEAQRIVNSIPFGAVPYVAKMLEPAMTNHTNYSGKLNIKPSYALDRIFKAYQASFNYYASGGTLSVNELRKSEEYGWIKDIGTALLYTAQFFGSKTNKPMLEADSIAYCYPSINKNGSIRIPKFGTFEVEPKIVLAPTEHVSFVTIKKVEGDYIIDVKAKSSV